MGDPRDNIIKHDANVFAKHRQNENFVIDDTNWSYLYFVKWDSIET